MLVRSTRIFNVTCEMPEGSAYPEGVGCELIKNVEGSAIEACTNTGGTMCFSLGACTQSVIVGNIAARFWDYGFEAAVGSIANVFSSNNVQGSGNTGVNGLPYGFENSTASHRNHYLGNKINGVQTPIRITTDSTGVTQAGNSTT